jgi:3-(3-hydroxy-phenyl)propionate hydroxylase
MVIGPKNHRRFEIALNPGETAEDFKDEQHIWNLLSKWLKPEDATLWRHACYEFHALVAQRWRVDRAFIAGDAAHQQPPFLGQGMCQGIRDVVNLSWKLEQAIKFPLSTQILDSYELERKGHVKALTAKIIEIGKIVGQRDEAKATSRDQHLLQEANGQIKPSARQDVQPKLSSGFFSPKSHPKQGTLFPQPLIRLQGQEQLMDDALGTGWRVFACATLSKHDSPQGNTSQHALKLSDNEMLISMLTDLQFKWFEFELPTQDPQHLLETWFSQAQAKWVIIRPDHYVYGAGTEHLELAEQLVNLKHLLGR